VSGTRDDSYNATFTYPTGGAIEYVRALLRDLPEGALALGESIQSIDVDARIVQTSKRRISFERLVTSAPLPSVLQACGVAHDGEAFTANQVLVLNLGFDQKGRDDVHWLYFADPTLAFYRVGFYDNILNTSRMSLYVEIGMPGGAPVDVAAAQERVLADLERARIVTTQALIASHHVVMKPAYVHVTKRSLTETARCKDLLARHGVHPIGRYGGWTYCSIEDDIVEARALAAALR
jgi:protoporphyrinogen oxidase